MAQKLEDLFVSSVNAYFRDRAKDIITQISENTFFPTCPQDSWMRINSMFRDSLLLNTTNRQLVEPCAERLVRWDTRRPRIIFQTGFHPQISSDTATYPPSAFDLRAHIEEDEPSIFVSTMRDYWDSTTELMRWEPLSTTKRSQRYYEYEIFVHGGLDANFLLGEHLYSDRHIVAFPGGIRPEFIRSAREYFNGKVVHVWWNPVFSTNSNPPEQMVPLTSLVPPLPANDKGPCTYYVEPMEDDILTTLDDMWHLQLADSEHKANRMMTGEGVAVRIPSVALARSLDYAAEPPRHKVASFLHPLDRGKAYFFCANNYAIVNIKPGTTNDSVAWGPKPICDSWPSLVEARFGYIDAAVSNPSQLQEVYFFFQDQYALINVVTETAGPFNYLDGPWGISAEWPCLHQAGFRTVDAILPNPRNKKEAYFFCGSKYALVNISKGPNHAFLVNGPKDISSNWPSLKVAGFEFVDAALPNPKNSNEAYFFSGNEYVLVKFKPGTVDDRIVNGPKLIRTEWPSLHEVSFW